MTELFASKITNLTDARYFAAFMPTYMSMPVSKPSDEVLSHMADIMNWVEGVTWLLEVDHLTHDIAAFSALPFQGTLYRGPDKLSDHSAKFVDPGMDLITARDNGYLSGADQIILPTTTTSADVERISNVLDKPLWLRVADLSQWERMLPVRSLLQGVVVEGGQEEKVGFKSFDTMDQLLEEVIYG